MTDVSNFSKTTPFPVTVMGNSKYKNVTGAKFLTSICLPSDSNQYSRFSNYTFMEYLGYLGDIYYYWRKYNLNEYFNLNDRQYNHSNQCSLSPINRLLCIRLTFADHGFFIKKSPLLSRAPLTRLFHGWEPCKLRITLGQNGQSRCVCIRERIP